MLVIGSGSREHALAWRLAQSTVVGAVFVAPANGGIKAAAGKITAVEGKSLILPPFKKTSTQHPLLDRS